MHPPLMAGAFFMMIFKMFILRIEQDRQRSA